MAEATIYTDKDAYVDEASPDTNFGGGNTLYVRSQGGFLGDGDRRLYCGFDLGQLPDDAAVIDAAELHIHLDEQSTLERQLRCHEVAGAWTETELTWNSQPATDADHGTEPSSDTNLLWVVDSTVREAFPDGRVAFRIKDDTEGSTDAPQQEADSREAAGQGPRLVLFYQRAGNADFSSTITVSKNQFSDLATDLQPRVDGDRFQGFQRIGLTDGAGADVKPWDVAYDVGRDAFWVTDNNTSRVHRIAPDGTHEQAYAMPDTDFTPYGIAYDGTNLWISDELDDTIRRFTIGETELTQEASYSHNLRSFLAWDGSSLWSVDPVGQTVYKHTLDDTLSVAESHDVATDVWGLAFVDDEPDPYLIEHEPFGEHTIGHRLLSDFSLIDSWPNNSDGADTHGLAFLRRQAGGPLINGEEDAADLLRRATLVLSSQVAIGKLIGTSDLDTTVQPANLNGHADLTTQVDPGVGDEVDLSSTVTPQPTGSADLDATVQPGGLSGVSDVTSTVRPGTSEVSVQARTEGSVAPTIEVDAADFAEISAEMGSEITHTQDGGSTSLRRVVQLVDTQTSKTFPREATSEHGRSSTHDRLGRGDAILYAKQGDTFQPGDTVAYDGLSWEVVGVLGWETVGDERVYQEVGLRRLSVTAQAQAMGIVEISQHVDLLSELTVNVP